MSTRTVVDCDVCGGRIADPESGIGGPQAVLTVMAGMCQLARWDVCPACQRRGALVTVEGAKPTVVAPRFDRCGAFDGACVLLKGHGGTCVHQLGAPLELCGRRGLLGAVCGLRLGHCGDCVHVSPRR